MDTQIIPQDLIELISWHEQLWAESVAIIEATCQRTAMEAKASYTRHLSPGTLVFAKSEDAHAYIRRMARRS
jgi:hypothetical protein